MRYRAFLSHSSADAEWVDALERHLKQALAAAGESDSVFLDRLEIDAGDSFVTRLQDGLSASDHLVLVSTPQAFASAWVTAEWENFLRERMSQPSSRIFVLELVKTPLPPFLGRVQAIPVIGHDAERYREGLKELMSRLLGREYRGPLPEDSDIPTPPAPPFDPALRDRLIRPLAKLLQVQAHRWLIAAPLFSDEKLLEGHPGAECKASALLVTASAGIDPVTGALRVLDVAEARLQSLQPQPPALAALLALRPELVALTQRRQEADPLEFYFERVRLEHRHLIPLLEGDEELVLLDPVHVDVEVQVTEQRAGEASAAEAEEGVRAGRMEIDELLDLDPAALTEGTAQRCWALLGGPGSGKSTLLRHLARRLAGDPQRRWVPIFEPLPELVHGLGSPFDRIEARLGRPGRPVDGLQRALEACHDEGRLLFLIDGLDEMATADRARAIAELLHVVRTWSKAAVVVTSRIYGFGDVEGFREATLVAWDEGRQKDFLARWFGRHANRAETARAVREWAKLGGLRPLTGNPLYLTLIAMLLERDIAPQPRHLKLYGQILDLLLKGRHRRPEQPMHRRPELRRVLAALAFRLNTEPQALQSLESLAGHLDELARDPSQPEVAAAVRALESAYEGLPEVLGTLARRTSLLAARERGGNRWDFLHRSFGEALCAEALQALDRGQGRAALLEQAKRVGNQEQWAEPFALLIGSLAEPDELVLALAQVNHQLTLRALSTAQGVATRTVETVLELTQDREERVKVFQRLPELIDQPVRTLDLLDRLRRETRDGDELFFLDLAVRRAARRWPQIAGAAEALLASFFDHLKPDDAGLELLRKIEIQGRPVPLWARIKAGKFQMGSPEGVGDSEEHPQHEVRVVSPFRMARVPVTQAQYALFDPEHRSGPVEGVPAEELADHPVTNVTWYAAVSFCRWLARWLPEAGGGARLPTEEEWEYACRAGSETEYWNGDGEAALGKVGWYAGYSDGRTHRVGELLPNDFGIYDLHGNVWEWTASPWAFDYTQAASSVDSAAVDPVAKVDLDDPGDEDRVLRGGSFAYDAPWARSAFRYGASPTGAWGVSGFRVVLPAPSDGA